MNNIMNQLDVSIIVVNYNSGRLLKGCLCSIYQELEHLTSEVIVVDNDSIDGSVEMIKQNFPILVLLRNKENLGFAKAVNQGLRVSKGQYALLVNPDVVFLNTSLYKLVHYMEQHPEVGIAGPKVYDDESKQIVQLSCRRFPSYMNALFSRYSPLTKLFPNNRFSKRFLMTDWNHGQISEVDWVSGCWMLIRAEMLSKIGLLDESYTLFFEDVDICFRAWKNGWKVVYYPEAEIVHYIGKSVARVPIKSICNRHVSMKYFYDKYYRRSFIGGLPIIFAIYGRMIFLLIVATLKNTYLSLRTRTR